MAYFVADNMVLSSFNFYGKLMCYNLQSFKNQDHSRLLKLVLGSKLVESYLSPFHHHHYHHHHSPGAFQSLESICEIDYCDAEVSDLGLRFSRFYPPQSRLKLVVEGVKVGPKTGFQLATRR